MFGIYQNSPAQALSRQAMARIERLGGTRRFWEMNRLEQYYLGTQHDGKRDWWEDVPVRERMPCILSGLPKAATEQAVRFTFGEGKFPSLMFTGDDKPKRIGSFDVGLSKEESETLNQLWLEMSEQIKIKLVFREALRRGLATRTTCGIYSLRSGKLHVELLNAKNCKVEYGADRSRGPIKLECRYIFPREERQPDGLTREVWYWYRRVVDESTDTVYEAVPVNDGDEPKWTIDAALTVQHDTGFAPIFWAPNLPRMDVEDDDGVALIDGCFDEVDAIDYSLSVRHSGAIFWGSPQGWETGVVEGKGPDATGRPAVDIFKTSDGGTARFADVGNAGGSARKRSVSSVWKFEEPDVKLGLLEPSGGAAEMVTAHILDVRARLLESIQVVLVDPAAVAGAGDMSAKLLELMYAPLLALVDDLRECWGDHLLGLAGSMMRFCSVHAKKGGTIFLPSLEAASPILERFLIPMDDGGEVWINPPCELGWGDHFTPTHADVKEAVVIAKSARGGDSGGPDGDAAGAPLITRRRAIDYVSQYFGITDVDAELEELEKETAVQEQKDAEKADRELNAALTQIGAKAGAPGAGKTPPGNKAKPSNPGGRAPGGKNPFSK